MKFASFYFIDYFIVFFLLLLFDLLFRKHFRNWYQPCLQFQSQALKLLQLYQKEIVCNELKLFEINISYILDANPVQRYIYFIYSILCTIYIYLYQNIFRSNKQTYVLSLIIRLSQDMKYDSYRNYVILQCNWYFILPS